MSFSAAIEKVSRLIESRELPAKADESLLLRPRTNIAAVLTSAYFLALGAAELKTPRPGLSDLLQGAARLQLKKVTQTAEAEGVSWFPIIAAVAQPLSTFNPGTYWLANVGVSATMSLRNVLTTWWEGEGKKDVVEDPEGSGNVDQILKYTEVQLRVNNAPETYALRTLRWTQQTTRTQPSSDWYNNVMDFGTSLVGKVSDAGATLYSDGKKGVENAGKALAGIYKFIILITVVVGAILVYAMYAKTVNEVKSFT